ncbi:hypothetical protein KEM48_007799 [Puccinia striiformis f. sp. tritici PST-130]|nr:hypothetical protein KEM48_007799 [Puccinia striiformis f. sp. tritici PST-130]
MSTSLYAPFRLLGPQTNLQVILTSVGLGWALWSTDSLRLLAPHTYTHHLIERPSSGLVLALSANQIYIYKRTRVVSVLNASDQKTRNNHPPQSDHTSTNDSNSEADAGPESWIERFKKADNPKQCYSRIYLVWKSSCWSINMRKKLSGFGILERKVVLTSTPTYYRTPATFVCHHFGPSFNIPQLDCRSISGGQLAIYNIQTGIDYPTDVTSPPIQSSMFD